MRKTTAKERKRIVQNANVATPKEQISELNKPIWAVINHQTSLATGMTYSEARNMVDNFTPNIQGLCVVSNEAAARVKSPPLKRRGLHLIRN